MKRLLALLLLLVISVSLCACVDMHKEVAALPKSDIQTASAGVRYIAHRGLTYGQSADGTAVRYGENTRQSFANAAATATFWGIETDVWQTIDGQLVCMHDKDAVSNVPDVHQATAREVLSNPLKKAPDYYAPTFQTYLEVCRAGDKVAVVEIKDGAMSEECLNDVLAAIAESGVEATVISFYLDKLAYVRSQNATIPCMLLFHDKWQRYYQQAYGTRTDRDTLLQYTLSEGIGLSFEYKYLYKNRNDLADYLVQFRASGLPIGVWTVDDVDAAIYHATALGVDYITTNVDMGALVAERI